MCRHSTEWGCLYQIERGEIDVTEKHANVTTLSVLVGITSASKMK